MIIWAAIIVVATLAAMTSGKIPPVLALAAGLALAGLTRVAPAEVLFSGLSNAGVITVGGMLVIAKGVVHTGIVTRLMARFRHAIEHAGDLVVGEAVGRQALAGAVGHQLLRARAGRHALGLDPDQATRPSLGRDRRPEQRVDLLRRRFGDGGRLVLGVARRDPHLGAASLLAVAHALGDMRGQRLGLEGLAQDHLVDRLVDDLLEARHVRALLIRVEIDEAFELRVEELLAPVRPDADDLLDAGDADAREAHLRRWAARLDVRGLLHKFSHRIRKPTIAGRVRWAIAKTVVYWPRLDAQGSHQPS